MNGQYPRFKNSYFYEELTEHFLLTTAELEFVRSCRGNANRQGMAILLKGLEYLGYFPENLQQVPPSIRSFVGKQLGLLTDLTNQYPWESSTRERHLAQIREVTGWLFQLRLELPAEAELQRLVNAALNGYFYDLYEQMTAQLPLKVQTQLDELLVVPPDGAISHFESLKADAANPGVNNLEREISKLKTLLAVGVPPEAFRSIPWKVLQMLKRRAWNEKASEMREHPQGVRYALIATFVHVRLAEVTDDAVKMLVEIIQRLDRRSDQQVYRELLRDLQRVEGKIQILFRVAEVVITKPEGTIREVLFPVVKEETFLSDAKLFANRSALFANDAESSKAAPQHGQLGADVRSYQEGRSCVG